jgi:hypothetical protein
MDCKLKFNFFVWKINLELVKQNIILKFHEKVFWIYINLFIWIIALGTKKSLFILQTKLLFALETEQLFNFILLADIFNLSQCSAFIVAPSADHACFISIYSSNILISDVKRHRFSIKNFHLRNNNFLHHKNSFLYLNFFQLIQLS